MKYILTPGSISFADIANLLDEKTQLVLDKQAHKKIKAAEQTVKTVLQNKQVVYGINTGFGKLAHTRINSDDLHKLQRHLVLSHAAGTGELLDDKIVRLILILKINSLARGYSGVRLETIEALIALVNEGVYPCIPAQGSVGASGDLAPLAHLSATLLGEGEARYQGKIISAKSALQKIKMKPLQLAPKEGLALVNGTQVSTALALTGLLAAEELMIAALCAGGMSVDATKSSNVPFDPRIQQVRGSKTQEKIASALRNLLKGSAILASHQSDCDKIQDPYSLRCQPQVMGACLMQLNFQKEVIMQEANAVSDNPLVFADDNAILSGGNFHAEPIALAADGIANCIAEIGALSERRIALLIDPSFSGLPAFLVNAPGINSGFMIAQVTAASLASENKSLAHPASVDSIPTSANQEDHVSMATFAARRLLQMADNTRGIIAIELLAACQGIDFLRPLKSSALLERIHRRIREDIAFYKEDRFFAPDIAACIKIIASGALAHISDINIWS